jgi:hypothetical protein
MILKPGDQVLCRVKDNVIVSSYSKFDCQSNFEVVAEDEFGWYLYVPPYIHIKYSFKVDSYNYQSLKIDKKFIGENVVKINEIHVESVIRQLVGEVCSKCKEFVRQAEKSGEFFTCWSCRQNPYR